MVATVEPLARTGWLIEDQRHIVLFDISWVTYEAILADHESKSVPHFYYDQGVLEIVGPGREHERAKVALHQIVEIVSDAWSVDIEPLGSTTHKREDLQKGFEADSAFYVANAGPLLGKKELDLAVDPPADLVIEIDIANSSLARLPIYAAIGVPEVWRYVRRQVEIRALAGEGYENMTESRALPGLTSEVLAAFVEQARETRSTVWIRAVREWALSRRTATGKAGESTS